VLLMQTTLGRDLSVLGLAGLSFLVIAIGAPASILGGTLSNRFGSARVAAASLAGSALCCLAFGLAGGGLPPFLAVTLLLAWGATVATDSPHFSALSARACPPSLVGGALAIQNAIGFAITVAAIWLATGLAEAMGPTIAWLLLPGPILGLYGSRTLWLARSLED
ncbi:MAG: MFS transporter, partial [Gammaproteobacteria bacterium]|nr:MFS transporter [Gammaproteobacteria bacterium]